MSEQHSENQIEYQEIQYSVEDRIARVTLNAPQKRNALSFQMRDEFTHALKRAEVRCSSRNVRRGVARVP